MSARPTKIRWLGALSLEGLVSATMRTPLACRLRVMISPWKSLPTFLNEPMVAISLLLLVFRARDHRGLDGDLQAEDDRRRIRRAVAQRRTLSQRLSCLARNGRSPGEESRCDGVAAQTIEAQPVFGQIEPSQRPSASRANHKSGRRWRASVRTGKRSIRFGVGKETKGGKRGGRQREASRKRPALAPHRCAPDAIDASRSNAPKKVATTSLKLAASTSTHSAKLSKSRMAQDHF